VAPQLRALLPALAAALKPPERMSLSAWAERYAVLSSENSAAPGPWRAYPYQVGILDAFTDPSVEMISVMKSARIGWTRIIDHAIGYSIHQDPASLLVVQPAIEDAEDYSRDELEPYLRDTPVLAGLVAEARSRDAHSTVRRKNFPGGSIRLIGANAPRGFRRITVKRVFFDEIDGYDIKGAGVEGDQIALGIKRASTYYGDPGYKIALGSTPTVKGASRIEDSYGQSDQRKYFVPCPHCGEEQEFIWENFRWPEGRPDEVRYACAACGVLIEEREKYAMVGRGRWIATAPFKGHAGFYIWSAYSFSPGAAWPKIAQEYEEARKLPSKLRVFVMQTLGRTHEETGEHPDDDSLQARREQWEGVPEGVLFTTIGVDVQGDRLEYEIVGWGADEESWSLEYGVIRGDPGGAEVWRDLSDLITERKPSATCVDSGGHHTQQVYAFCRARQRVYAIKGSSGSGRTVWPRAASKGKRGARLFVIGVDAAKDAIYSLLRIQRPGPGYCHFPKGRDLSWFSGLTSETVLTKYSKGFPVREYKLRPGMRNEPLDCRVYAYAALCSFGRVHWGSVAARQKKREEAAKPQEQAPNGEKTQQPALNQQPLARRFAVPRRRNFVTGWR
jgi:phage terminase large subunit GpA-like protein